MKLTFYFGVITLFIVALSACEKPRVFVEEGMLDFSADTLKYDSIFTTHQAPTGRLIVTNNTKKNVRISRVWLNSGLDSELSLIVDGVVADDVSDVELAKGDSLHVFVTFTSTERDNFIEEFINFEVGGELQQVMVRARIIDAYLIRTERDSLGRYLIPVIRNDTTLPTDKFIVVDGPLVVEGGATLTLAAGTRIAFTPFKDDNFNLFSMIYVDTGRLVIQGMPGMPVQLHSSRFDSTSFGDYKENPGQWRGLWFTKNSYNNHIEHALIKNGLIGIRIDSTAYRGSNEPKLTMKFTEIRNMAAYGIWGLGFDPNGLGDAPMLVMENCLVHNCAERTILANGGGNYEFYNCTFANYNFGFIRRTPQLYANNYLYDPVSEQIIGEYDLRFRMTNSILYGTEEEELLLEDFGKSFDVVFDHTLVKTSEDPERMYDYSPYFLNHLQNMDPLFNSPRDFDYRPMENSPVIDAGIDLSTRFDVDIRDNFGEFPRNDATFDLGAYEYYPIEM